MSEHKVTIIWERESDTFTYQTYNREHTWEFDGGATLRASAAPEYLGKPEFVDPEQAFVGAVSSCHMLTFLAVAAKMGFVVDDYVDEAVGYLEKNEEGKLWISRVVLDPKVTFSGEKQPDAETLAVMHTKADKACFIANSVKSEVTLKQ